MSFPDKSADSVHSLLALLRSAQGDNNTARTATANTPSLPSSSSAAYVPNAVAPPRHHVSHGAQQQPQGQGPVQPVIPSKRQLDDLLTSLNARPAPSSTTAKKDSPRQNLIEPFGPVGQTPTPTKLPYDPQIRVDPPPSSSRSPSDQFVRRTSSSSADVGTPTKIRTASTQSPSNVSKGANRSSKHPRDRVDETGYGVMSFGKALPILTELLGEEGFRKELKRMKADQDALERRLWAKGEKVKAEHERGIQAEKEVAKIARKPIPSEKRAEWAKSLALSMKAFYADQCLPSLDGLALRQMQRLVELGVPGLAGDDRDPKRQERVKRIMDVLEAGLEE